MIEFIVDDGHYTGTQFLFVDEEDDDISKLLSLCFKHRKNMNINFINEQTNNSQEGV